MLYYDNFNYHDHKVHFIISSQIHTCINIFEICTLDESFIFLLFSSDSIQLATIVILMSLVTEKTCLQDFKADSNQCTQLHRKAKILKFCMWQVWLLPFLESECAGWSAPLLFSCSKGCFSRDRPIWWIRPSVAWREVKWKFLAWLKIAECKTALKFRNISLKYDWYRYNFEQQIISLYWFIQTQ